MQTILFMSMSADTRRNAAVALPGRWVRADELPGRADHHEWRLARGRVHEFWGADVFGGRRVALTPLTVLVVLAGREVRRDQKVVFVGRECWPTFQVVCAALTGRPDAARGPGDDTAMAGRVHAATGWVDEAERVLRRCVFLDPLTARERYWAIGEALRCPAVGAVIGDGTGLDATASRRLQLAAEAGARESDVGGAVGLLARPWWEKDELSWAATRWEVRAGSSTAQENPRHVLSASPPCDAAFHAGGWMRWELVHAGGREKAARAAPRRWILAWKYRVFCGTGIVDLSADVGCGTGATEYVAGRPCVARTG